MIKSVQIRNFKSFAKLQEIPLRPLTLIFGEKNSGQSGIIQSLIFAKNLQENIDYFKIGKNDKKDKNYKIDKSDKNHKRHNCISNENGDLHNFIQYVHNHDAKLMIDLGLNFDASLFDDILKKIFCSNKEITVKFSLGFNPYEIHEQTNSIITKKLKPSIQEFKILADKKTFLEIKKHKNGKLMIENFDYHNQDFLNCINCSMQIENLSKRFSF
jgi:AAA15 family ATPase/GTPase